MLFYDKISNYHLISNADAAAELQTERWINKWIGNWQTAGEKTRKQCAEKGTDACIWRINQIKSNRRWIQAEIGERGNARTPVAAHAQRAKFPCSRTTRKQINKFKNIIVVKIEEKTRRKTLDPRRSCSFHFLWIRLRARGSSFFLFCLLLLSWPVYLCIFFWN